MKKFKKIYIEITNICNLKCSFCPQDDTIKQEMTLDNFEMILKKIEGFTDYIYLHVKGEPLIHSQFKEIIQLALKYNKKVNITTNGTLIKNHIETLKQVRQINVSLQSMTNLDKLDEVITACEELSQTTYISYRFWVKNKNEKEIKSKIILNKNIFISEEKQFIWPDINNKTIKKEGTCKATKDHIAILVDGTVIPCCLDSKGIINLGNIFTSDLQDIINCERFVNMNKGFSENKLVEELCQKCGWRNL